MASVGSYVLSINERAGEATIDKKTACARVLKLLGARTSMPHDALLSETGFPADLLREVLDQLQRDELVVNADGQWTLTELGYKAHFIVAT